MLNLSREISRNAYRIFCFKVLCNDKVVSPVMHLLHSVVQMCTVQPWDALSPRDSKPREVAQLDATIGALSGEDSSIHFSEDIGEVLLRAPGRDNAEIGQCCFIFSECTVLDFQCHRQGKLAGC